MILPRGAGESERDIFITHTAVRMVMRNGSQSRLKVTRVEKSVVGFIKSPFAVITHKYIVHDETVICFSLKWIIRII